MGRLKNALFLASGTKKDGGSGMQAMVEAAVRGMFRINLVGVASQFERGGVWERAVRLEVPFYHLPGPWTPEAYRDLIRKTNADLIFLAGWDHLVVGVDPRIATNVHPAPLPGYGGKGWHGLRVHERMLAARDRGEVACTAVSIHFVTAKFDDGPVIFLQDVEMPDGITAKDLQDIVKTVEHRFQWRVNNLVARGLIAWDGHDPESVRFPAGYQRYRDTSLVEDERLIF